MDDTKRTNGRRAEGEIRAISAMKSKHLTGTLLSSPGQAIPRQQVPNLGAKKIQYTSVCRPTSSKDHYILSTEAVPASVVDRKPAVLTPGKSLITR
ncbi:MAG: hypothetical protein Q9218_006822 [Villophora microphyllina]